MYTNICFLTVTHAQILFTFNIAMLSLPENVIGLIYTL